MNPIIIFEKEKKDSEKFVAQIIEQPANMI